MTLKEKFMEYDKKVPTQMMELSSGHFEYRYYKNPNPVVDITIVALVGGMGAGDGFFYMYDKMLSQYSFISFNYPEHFKNNRALADAIVELINKLQLKNVYLLGQSYGGLLAQIIARRHPECIKGMILSGTCSLSGNINFKGMCNIVDMIHPKKIEKNIKMDKKLPLFLLFPILKAMCGKKIEDKAVAKTFGEILDICKPTLTGDYLAHMDTLLGDLATEFGTHTPKDFEKYKDEVLIFFSKTDTTFCDNLKEALVKIMPNPKVVENLPGGHLAAMVSLDEYSRVVGQFLLERNT